MPFIALKLQRIATCWQHGGSRWAAESRLVFRRPPVHISLV